MFSNRLYAFNLSRYTFKRYLRIILHGNVAEEDRIHKLSPDMIEWFDDLIELLGEYLSNEFNRKGKSSKKLCRWKATEFHTFLLYTGLIILKEALSEDEYKNFLYFFVAMRLLLSPSLTKRQIKSANLCLRKYVYEFSILYGDHHLVNNFHNLIHLTDDYDFLKHS